MLTVNTKARITRKNHVLKLDLKDIVPDGEYQVLVVLETVKQSIKKPIHLRTSNAKIDASLTFNREEMYGDNGR